jgi:D-alanyl-D-alanine carboxypeptidase/D-alanyl-D-alanine-endopeptidase (penicillin-binding protein 4)
LFCRRFSDRSNAQSSVRATLASFGAASVAGSLDLSEWAAVDGSGLSRHNLAAPAFLAALLAFAPADYVHLLPLAGQTGDLARRFVGTAANGRLYGKTGHGP